MRTRIIGAGIESRSQTTSRRPFEPVQKSALDARLFPVDRSRHSPYVPRNFEGGVSSPRERVAQPVEQLTFNQ